MDSLRGGKSELVNTNKLVRNYRGATGLKTGSTSLALYNLSASATRDDLSLIAVIMKAPTTKDRFAEATKLLDYGFANYSFTSFGKKGDVVKEIPVSKGVSSSVNAVLANNAGVLLKKGEESNVVQNIELSNNISAPINEGDKLGTISYSLNGETLTSIDIIAKNSVNRIDFPHMLQFVFNSWIK